MSLSGTVSSDKEIVGQVGVLNTIHGKSAYEIALLHGFEGTEQEWLDYIESNSYRLTDAEKEEVANIVEDDISLNYTKKTEFDSFKTETENDVNVLEARMNTFTSLPSGSTTGDAELQDIRVGEDGCVYESAGESVRSQFAELNTYLIEKESNCLEPTNLFSVLKATQGAYLNEFGEKVVNSLFILSDYISVEGFTNVYVSTPTGNIINFYNKNKEWLRSITTYAYKINITDDVAYLRIAFNKKVQLADAYVGVVPAGTEKYKYTLKNTELPNQLIEKSNALTEKTIDLLCKGKMTQDVILDEYGTTEENSLFALSDYICVANLTEVYVSTPKDNLVNFYNGNKEWVSSIRTNGEKVLIPSSVEFLRIGFRKDIQLPTAYVRTKKYVSDGVYPISLEKYIHFDGDSVTEGYHKDSQTEFYNYPLIVHNNLGVNYSCVGASARGYCVKDQRSTKFTLLESVQNYSFPDSENNIIYLACGVNDFQHNISLGDENGTDITTFYGAFNKCIEHLTSKYPKSLIVIATPIHFVKENIPNSVGLKLVDYVNALTNRAKYYGLPICDMWNEFGYNPNFANVKSAMFDSIGLHPYTEIGTTLFGNRVTSILKKYLEF